MPRFDPHSWCDGDQPRQRHLDLDLTVDFSARTLAGTARIHLREAAEGLGGDLVATIGIYVLVVRGLPSTERVALDC